MILNFIQLPVEKNSTHKEILQNYYKEGILTKKESSILEGFFNSYKAVMEEKNNPAPFQHLFMLYIECIKDLKLNPFEFKPYHEHIRSPFDYYHFGIEFLRPLVDLDHSTTVGLEQFDAINQFLEKGENAILFANHQIEADPQAISLLLEKAHPKIAEEMIFVAGERVTTDPLAVPFSLGRNLLCIYSKKYIDNPPDLKHQKQLHNKRTMQLMSKLLSEGGKCIYVAPSGGRDRPNEKGVIEIAPFDAQSIEMFYLMARQSKKPTHFFPLALKTHVLLPPPATIQIELGEARKTQGGAIHLALGKEIDMESLSKKDIDKQLQRQIRATLIWNLVKSEYASFR